MSSMKDVEREVEAKKQDDIVSNVQKQQKTQNRALSILDQRETYKYD